MSSRLGNHTSCSDRRLPAHPWHTGPELYSLQREAAMRVLWAQLLCLGGNCLLLISSLRALSVSFPCHLPQEYQSPNQTAVCMLIRIFFFFFLGLHLWPLWKFPCKWELQMLACVTATVTPDLSCIYSSGQRLINPLSKARYPCGYQSYF